MAINVGDYIKAKREIAGKNGEIEIIDQYYKVLLVDEYIEVISFGNSSPFDFDMVHEYDECINMKIIPESEIRAETIFKKTIHRGIEVEHDVAQRYIWQGKEVVIPLPQIYFNGTEVGPMSRFSTS